MRTFKYVCLVSIALALAGCNVAIVKSASGTDEAKAKLFVPDSERALVYVFRDDSFLGGKLTSQFVVNKVVAAKTERNRFNIVSLSPGKYDLLSISSEESSGMSMVIHNSKKVPVALTVESGKLYFLQEVFKPMSGFSLKVVSQKEAEPVIKKGKLIALNRL